MPRAAQCPGRERSPWPWPAWLVVSLRAIVLARDRSRGGTHPGVKGSPGELSPSPSPLWAGPPEWLIQAAASRTGGGTSGMAGLGAPWSPCPGTKPRHREPRGSEPRALWPQRVPSAAGGLCFWKRRFGGFFSVPHSTLVPRPMASGCPPGSPHPAPGGTFLVREGNLSPVIRLARVRAGRGWGAVSREGLSGETASEQALREAPGLRPAAAPCPPHCRAVRKAGARRPCFSTGVEPCPVCVA